MVARPSTSSDYLSLAKKTLDPHHHDHHASRRGCSEAVNESYGYLFTGLALILPVLRRHAYSQASRHDGGDGIDHGDRTGGLVIATKKKRDKKGKGRAIDETSGQGSPANGLTGGDMIVLFRLICLLAGEYQTRSISRTDETLYDLSTTQLYASTVTYRPQSNGTTGTRSQDHTTIRPLDGTSVRETDLTAFQAGAELAKAFKVALEGLMDLDVAFRCRQDTIKDEVELVPDQGHEQGELVRGCLALCLYILCKTQPANNTSFYTLQLQELYPTYLKSADSILDSLFAESPIMQDSGPSTPVSPVSTNHPRLRYRARQDPPSPSSSSRLPRGSQPHADRYSLASHSTARRPIFLPSRPSMISIFSTESNGTTTGRSFMSYSGSIRSNMTARDGFLTKSTASLPQLSQQVANEMGAREAGHPHAEFSTLGSARKNSRMRSMVDLPKAGKSSGLSIAEERLRRYQRNAAIEAQHSSPVLHTGSKTTIGLAEPVGGGSLNPGKSAEKGWFSTFNFGTRRFNSRTGSERRADRESGRASSPRLDEEQRLLTVTVDNKEETSTSKPVLETRPSYGQDLDSVCESGYKQALPHTPAATPAASRQLPLLVSPCGAESTYEHPRVDAKPLAPKRTPRAFEDASDPPLAPMDPRLLEAEMSSAMTQKVVCAVCHAKGVNFPSCRKCGDTFCSRECRIGMGAGGDGKKHVCGLLETRLLARAAQSPNGNLLPSPPTVKPVKRVLIT